MVFKQSLDDMKNQFVLLQVNRLDHGVNHRKQEFFIAILNHVHIVTAGNDNFVYCPVIAAFLIENLQTFNLEPIVLAFRQGLKIFTVYFERPSRPEFALLLWSYNL